MTDATKNIAAVLAQSGSSNSSNQNDSSAALAAVSKIGDFAISVAELGTKEGAETALSIVSLVVVVSSDTISENTDTSNDNTAVAALGSLLLNILASVILNTPLDESTGSVAIIIGALKIAKQLVKFNGEIRSSIEIPSSSRKREAATPFSAGVNPAVMTSYVNANTGNLKTNSLLLLK